MALNLEKLGAVWEDAANQDQQIYLGMVVNCALQECSSTASAYNMLRYPNAIHTFHAHLELQHKLLDRPTARSANNGNSATPSEHNPAKTARLENSCHRHRHRLLHHHHHYSIIHKYARPTTDTIAHAYMLTCTYT